MPFSFLSLVLASSKLFNSQRLGILSDPNPSIKMGLLVFPINILLLLGPLFSLVLFTSYFKHYVIVFILGTMSMHYWVLKLLYLNEKETHLIISKLYNKNNEHGLKEAKSLFYNSVFTSWISPSTVWTQNGVLKSRYLMTSALITFAFYSLALTGLYFGATLLNFDQLHNPPIIHCFNKLEYNSSENYRPVFSGNITIWSMFEIVYDQGNSTSKIRICSKTENSTTLLKSSVLPVAFGLTILGLISSVL